MKSRSKIFPILITLFLLIASCSQKPLPAQEPSEQPPEEIIDTGVIAVESSPSQARVYINNELKGESPLTLYNFPVGKHEISVKKEGYEDFSKTITLQLGKTEEISAVLSEVKTGLQKPADAASSAKKTEEKPNQSAADSGLPLNLKKVSINGSFVFYYDLKGDLFGSTVSASPDVFSSNYNSYLYFTSYSPATMRILNKGIKDVKKEDCAATGDTISNLYSGQTLCVKTTNGLHAAVGGAWEDSPREIYWILFS